MTNFKYIMVAGAFLLSACETTTPPAPYKAPVRNLVQYQKAMNSKGLKARVDYLTTVKGINLTPNCRLLGPLVVAPGSNPLQYIKEAMEEELFTAGAYDVNSDTVIKGRMDRLDFDSFGTGHWNLAITVSSKHLPEGYQVSIRNIFKTSFTAIGACKNAARAYGPAVQSLLNGVVTNPKFPQLVGANN